MSLKGKHLLMLSATIQIKALEQLLKMRIAWESLFPYESQDLLQGLQQLIVTSSSKDQG